MIQDSVTIPYDVSDVIEYMNEILRDDVQLSEIRVLGEVSKVTRSQAGHWYFTIKDAAAALNCVMYRGKQNGARLPEPGARVIVCGAMTIYAQRGEMQLIASAIELAGTGQVFLEFQRLKERLAALGYFDDARKRPVPEAARAIGIATSLNAAALRDIVRTLRMRWPLARVVIAHTLVQGGDAPLQIAQAIAWLNHAPDLDVILLARGGGAIEDLWAFNDPIVAEAMVRSRLPIVTGIGHETDFTIADFVADLRAPTPTAAAMVVSPDGAELRAQLQDDIAAMRGLMQARLEQRQADLATMRHRLGREHPGARLARDWRDLAATTAQMARRMRHRARVEGERLAGMAGQLHALSPLQTLARGYAAITRERDGAPVTSVAMVAPPEALAVRVRDGIIHAAVTATEPVL